MLINLCSITRFLTFAHIACKFERLISVMLFVDDSLVSFAAEIETLKHCFENICFSVNLNGTSFNCLQYYHLVQIGKFLY